MHASPSTALKKTHFSSLPLSFFIHLSFFTALWIIAQGTQNLDSKVEITVIEAPKVAPGNLKPVTLEKIKPEPKHFKAKAVFGVSKTSETVEPNNRAPTDVAVKAGNTIAKAPDQEGLKADDPNSLPIPADEYLVSQMPKMLIESRIPYPQEAKAKGVQGAVVMELLIDAAGRVREAKLISGPGSGLNEAAIQAVQEFKFSPAKIEDKSVAVKIRYAYRFVLER